MKKLLFSLFVMILGSTATFVGAQTMDEGYIKMEITDVASDNEQVAMQMEMMKGSQTEIYFKDSKNLSKMNMMGGMMEMSTLYNESAGTMDLLMNMMGQKMHIETTKEEMEAAQADQANAAKDVKVEFMEDDTKEILGYKTVKAVIKHPDMPEGTGMEVYIAKDIKASSKMLQGLQNVDLGGFPLEFTMKNPQFSMTMTALEISKDVSADVFDLNTAGYKKMSFKEFQEKMGAMSGGLGF